MNYAHEGDKDRVEEIFPENDLQLVVEHHDPHRIPNKNEHLVVHVGVLHYVPPHGLSRLVVHVPADLVVVLGELGLNFLQFS